ncbi:MAG TPA: glycosyltransferase 87 family protein [Solirubrobacteraceae bacterium]|nr:glycosyltransferase 87 family protein [Solirubrobacteraceae bacterium]
MSVHGPLRAEAYSGVVRLPASDVPERVVSSSRRGLLGLTGVLVCGSLLSVAAAHTRSLLPETIRFVPPSLAGAFGATGLNLHVGGAIAALSLMFVSYAVVVAASTQLSTRAVLIAVVALHAVVLLGPPLVSTDVFSYQAYARLGSVYSFNPYLNGPHANPFDHVFQYIGSKWAYIPSVYGPVFTAFSYLLASLSIATSVFAYKSIAAVASLALVAVVWRCARLRGINPVRAAALVGLNPLLVLYGVGGGHNDLLMLLAVAGSIWAMLASRERTGGGLMMVAIGVKLTAGLLLPFVFAAGGPGRGRSRRDLLLGAGVGFAVIAALSFAVFGSGAFHLLATVRQSQSEGDWKSIPGAISTRLGMPTVGHITQYVLAAAFVIICAWLVWRVWQGATDWIDGAGWAMLALLIASSSLLPWYVAWMLPLAALGHDRRLWRMAIVMTGIVQAIQLLGYIPHTALL